MWNSASSAAESNQSPPSQISGSLPEDSGADGSSVSSSTALLSDGIGAVTGETEFKGECANFLLFKRATTGPSNQPTRTF